MPRALIVESSPQDFTTCEGFLVAAGYDVQGTSDGNEGLKLARSFAADVVLLTVELQGMSGYSICNKMKKDPQLAQVPLVLVSKDASEEIFSQHRRLRTHADAYLRKPIAKAELEAALAEALGGSGGEAGPEPLPPLDANDTGSEPVSSLDAGAAAAFDGVGEPIAAPPAMEPDPSASEVTAVPSERTQVAPPSPRLAPVPTPLPAETTMAEALAEPGPLPAPAAPAGPGGAPEAESTVVRPVDPAQVAATLPGGAKAVAATSALEQQVASLAAALDGERDGHQRLGVRLREAEEALREVTAQLSRERLARQTALSALNAAQRALEASAAGDAVGPAGRNA